MRSGLLLLVLAWCEGVRWTRVGFVVLALLLVSWQVSVVTVICTFWCNNILCVCYEVHTEER